MPSRQPTAEALAAALSLHEASESWFSAETQADDDTAAFMEAEALRSLAALDTELGGDDE